MPPKNAYRSLRVWGLIQLAPTPCLFRAASLGFPGSSQVAGRATSGVTSIILLVYGMHATHHLANLVRQERALRLFYPKTRPILMNIRVSKATVGLNSVSVTYGPYLVTLCCIRSPGLLFI